MRVNSLVIAWFLVTGCSGARPDYFYPYGFGDVCTTDSDCVQDYHCSAPQGGRCTSYCGCDTAGSPPGCGQCPARCDDGRETGECQGFCEVLELDGRPECVVSR